MSNLNDVQLEAKYLTKHAVSDASDWMQSMVDNAERQLREMKKYQEMMNGDSTLAQKTDYVSWVTNETQQSVRGLETGARVAASLSEANTMNRVLKSLSNTEA